MATARKIPISVGKNRADPLEPVTGLAMDCNYDVRKRDEIARSTRWTSPIAVRACRLPEQVVGGVLDPRAHRDRDAMSCAPSARPAHARSHAALSDEEPVRRRYTFGKDRPASPWP